ncbi:Hypothetical predicted protein, partial [Paramuricea clavata]
NWYLKFLKDRRQRIVFQGTTCKWKDINKGVMQGTVTGPHFFNLFINDLEIKNCSNTRLVKFADDSSLLVPILKNTQDCSSKAIDEFKDWSESNSLPLNEGKCKEMIILKKGRSEDCVSPIDGFERHSSLEILGLTFEMTSRFEKCVKKKLVKANKCLFVIRKLRNEGYSQDELDLCRSLVLSQLTYGLSVIAASPPELTTIQNVLTRCYKRRYTSEQIDINILLEQTDRKLFEKLCKQNNHPLREICPKIKEYTVKLRTQEALWPNISTERFKNSFINRCILRYN